MIDVILMSADSTSPSAPPAAGEKSAVMVLPPLDNPYHPPNAPSGGGDESSGGREGEDGIKPARWASMAAIVGFSCGVVMVAVSIYATLDMFWSALASQGGASVPPTLAPLAYGPTTAIASIKRCIMYLTAVPFLIWFHRCYRNLTWLWVEGTRYSTKWAVGGWLIPILNLVRPYQVAREIWDASNPDVEVGEGPRGWLQKRTGHTVLTWWLLGLSPAVVWPVAYLLTQRPSLALWKLGLCLYIFSELLKGLTAIAAILLIRRLDARQAARQTKLRRIFAR